MALMNKWKSLSNPAAEPQSSGEWKCGQNELRDVEDQTIEALASLKEETRTRLSQEELNTESDKQIGC